MKDPVSMSSQSLPGLKQLQQLAAGATTGLGLSFASARQVDEVQWRQSCIDLHQVMEAARAVYLVLEHHNEALVRVAVELCTCKVGRKILWWNDNWYADDKKREHLRELVKEKLMLSIAHAKNTTPVVEEKVGADPEELASLQKKLEEAESGRKAAQHQQQIAELRCRDLEQSTDEAERQVEVLEANLTKLREQLRAQAEYVPPEPVQAEPVVDPALQERITELEEKLEQSERECASLTQIQEDLESKLHAAQEALAGARKAAQELEEEIKRKDNELEEERKRKQPKAEKPKERVIVKEVPKKTQTQDKGTQTLVEKVEVQKAAKETQTERDEAQGIIERLRAELQDAKKRAALAEAKLKGKEKPPPTPKEKPPKEVEIQHRDASTQAIVEEKPDTSAADRAKLEELTAQLEAARRRTVDAESALLELQRELLEAREQLAASLERPPEPQQKENTVVVTVAAPPPPPPPPPPPTEPQPQSQPQQPQPPPEPKEITRIEKVVQTVVPPELLEELEALRKKSGEYDKVCAKLAKREEQIAKLKEENRALEEEKLQMLQTLHQIKEQLRRVRELAEKKGMGKMIEELMGEVNDTMNGADYSCFDRLYDDALRRQQKHKDHEPGRSGSHRGRGAFAPMHRFNMMGTADPPFGQTASATWSGPLGQQSGHYNNNHPYNSVFAFGCPRCGYAPSGLQLPLAPQGALPQSAGALQGAGVASEGIPSQGASNGYVGIGGSHISTGGSYVGIGGNPVGIAGTQVGIGGLGSDGSSPGSQVTVPQGHEGTPPRTPPGPATGSTMGLKVSSFEGLRNLSSTAGPLKAKDVSSDGGKAVEFWKNKENALSHSKSVALLSDSPARRLSAHQLAHQLMGSSQQLSASSLNSTIRPPTTPPQSSAGTATFDFSPKNPEGKVRHRSRSPIDLMLQQRATGLPRSAMTHSKSEPMELPRLGVPDFSLASGVPSVQPGRMRGTYIVDRLRAVARERSNSSEAARRVVVRHNRFQDTMHSHSSNGGFYLGKASGAHS